MHGCSVLGCKNEGVHSFPRDEAIRKQWEQSTRRQNFRAAKHSKFCPAHFKPEDYRKEGYYSGLQNVRRILVKGAVPSVFECLKNKDPLSKQRRLRTKNRDAKQRLFSQDDNNEASPSLDYDIRDRVLETAATAVKSVVFDTECTSSDVHYKNISTQKNYQLYTVESFRHDDEGVLFYTGLENFEKFKFVYSTLCPEAFSSKVLHISAEDQFLLTLMKLRRNKEDYELGRFFDISASSVSSIFITWINCMHQKWEMLDVWPNKEMVNIYMPEEGFQKHHSTRDVDCTEVPIKKPTNPPAEQVVWSSNNNMSTVKLEVGASPSGLLPHSSEVYGGSTSEMKIFKRSQLLQKCEQRDSVMADHGYAQNINAPRRILINIPASLKNRSKLPSPTVTHDRKLSSKHLNIEQSLSKTYHILQAPINVNYVPLTSKLYFVCQMLRNFREGIVSNMA